MTHHCTWDQPVPEDFAQFRHKKTLLMIIDLNLLFFQSALGRSFIHDLFYFSPVENVRQQYYLVISAQAKFGFYQMILVYYAGATEGIVDVD